MPDSLRRPVAFVTGANRGIGRAIAYRLADCGFDIIATGLEPDDGGLVASLANLGAAAQYLAGDLGDLAAHARWMAALDGGAIDCLVNNAGMGAVARGDMLALTPENFDRVMAVNLRGTMFLTQAVLKRMRGTTTVPHPRSVITITSVSASHVSTERIDYCISKAALAMWVQGLAVRLAPEGIGVFDIRPGIIRSDMTAPVAEKYDRRIADGLVPAGRWGEGDDIAAMVAALATGAFAFATGTIIDAGGGLAIPRL